MDASSRPARAVLRIAKVKADGLDRLSRHDTRATPPANDDPAKGGTVWLTEATDPAAAVRAEIATHDKPPRKGATVAVQAIITARAEWFGDGSTREERAEAFTAHAMAWAKANLPGKLVAACRHDGEAAPHLHVWIVPVVETETAVNRRRPDLGRRPCRRLDYRSLYGGGRAEAREKMVALQDGIGEALAPLGIERGVSRTVSQAEHKPAWRWRAEQEAAAKAMAEHLAIQQAAAAKQQRLADQAAAWLAMAHEQAAKTARHEEEAAKARAAAEAARQDAWASKSKARAHEAAEAAKIAGLMAFEQGVLIDAEGPSGYLRPVFARGVGEPEQATVEQSIAADRQGVLRQIALLAAAIRATVAERVRDMLRAAQPLLSIQAAAQQAQRIAAEVQRAKRPPRQRQASEREI